MQGFNYLDHEYKKIFRDYDKLKNACSLPIICNSGNEHMYLLREADLKREIHISKNLSIYYVYNFVLFLSRMITELNNT